MNKSNGICILKTNESWGKSSKRNKIFMTLFILIQIQLTYESAPAMLRWSKETITIVGGIFIFLIYFYFIIFKKVKIEIHSLIITLFILSSSLFSIILNQDFYVENLYFINAVVTGFIISNMFNKDEYLDGYVNVIIIYSIYSLISTYIFLPLHMKGLLNFFPSYANQIGTPFVDMGLSFAVEWHGVMRNQGIFREPGVFQFFILLALAVEMFYKAKSSKGNIIILIVTLVTTFSTAGILCFIPLLYAYVLKIRKKNGSRKDIFIILGLLFSLYLIFKFQDDGMLVRLQSSLNKISQGADSVSFRVRFESIFNNLKMSINNPLFGNSFVKGFHYIQDNYNDFGTNDITGTMFSYIMALGYPAGLLINLMFYKSCKMLNKNFLINITIYIALFVSLNTQNLVYNSLLWTSMFMLYSEKNNFSYLEGVDINKGGLKYVQ